MRSFCNAKASLIFSTKNISVFGYKAAKHLTSWPLNELVKLTMLWTTVPCFYGRKFYFTVMGQTRCQLFRSKVSQWWQVCDSILLDTWQYIAGYTVANFCHYPVRRLAIFQCALESFFLHNFQGLIAIFNDIFCQIPGQFQDKLHFLKIQEIFQDQGKV